MDIDCWFPSFSFRAPTHRITDQVCHYAKPSWSRVQIRCVRNCAKQIKHVTRCGEPWWKVPRRPHPQKRCHIFTLHEPGSHQLTYRMPDKQKKKCKALREELVKVNQGSSNNLNLEPVQSVSHYMRQRQLSWMQNKTSTPRWCVTTILAGAQCCGLVRCHAHTHTNVWGGVKMLPGGESQQFWEWREDFKHPWESHQGYFAYRLLLLSLSTKAGLASRVLTNHRNTMQIRARTKALSGSQTFNKLGKSEIGLAS